MATQKERILALLRAYRERGVCSVRLTYEMQPRVMRPQSRISDLRQDGWQISSEPCDEHGGTDGHVKYRLTSFLLTPTPTKLESGLQPEPLQEQMEIS